MYLFLEEEKQNKTRPSTSSAKGNRVSFAGKCQLHSAMELIWKGGKPVKAIVVLWVPGGFFEHSLWLEFIFFYVLFWAWHSFARVWFSLISHLRLLSC